MRLRLEYRTVTELYPTKGNPKEHNLQTLFEIIKKYSFYDPLIANEETAEDGTKKLRIMAGHGRLETLYHIYQAVLKGELELPEGLDVNEKGELLVPVIIGKNLTVEEAKAFVIDHNNAGAAGGDFTALDVSRMYDMNAYVEMLVDVVEHVITVDQDDLDLMQQLATDSLPEPLEKENSGDTEERYTVTLVFADGAEKAKFQEILQAGQSGELSGQTILDLL